MSKPRTDHLVHAICLWRLMIALLFMLTPLALMGQPATPLQYQPRDPLYPHGKLEVGGIFMLSKYFGEFTDNNVGWGIGAVTRYAFPFIPEISLGARLTHGFLS